MWGEEVKRMRKICLPMAATNLVSYLKGMVSVSCMGRLGPLELAGGSLAVGVTNITGISVLNGLSLGLDPICSQAVGSRNHSLATSALRRTVILLLVASSPSLHSGAPSVLPSLPLLGPFRRLRCPNLRHLICSISPLTFPPPPLRSYLRSHSRPLPIAAASALSSLVLHLPLAPLLSHSLGISGIALSSSLSDFVTLLLLSAYFAFSHQPDHHASYIHLPTSSPPPSATAHADGWAPLFRLALPTCLAVCLEWWWYEFMTIAAGYLAYPLAGLGAAGIVIQTTALLYTLPTTLSAAAATRVGNELGAGRPKHARAAAAVSMGLSLAGSCLGLAWTTLGREAWARIFTADGDVLGLTRTALPLIGLCELANCPQTTGCGVLRGCARPAAGLVINLVSFYLVGAPVAVGLAFGLEMGFVGLCLGLLAAQVVCAASILVVTWRTDWEEEARKAADLVGPIGLNGMEEEKKATLVDGAETLLK
ncbi:hypothetical protein HPP92_016732 [Vanilla planifolia]|uniref:Protein DETOXIFICATION n=2 Tax=Vanilla planifolia TaxID=51239 RepID=A0A835QJS3_VANPL|nr:hypothetical protein HPP92_016732 [Vanilla planifolia]